MKEPERTIFEEGCRDMGVRPIKTYEEMLRNFCDDCLYSKTKTKCAICYAGDEWKSNE